MPELCVYRSPWGDFPDVIVQTNVTKLQSHPGYRAAKGGDMVAAFQASGKCLETLKSSVGTGEIVAVAQFDRDKNNALPIAYAILLGREMGIPVNSTVVQENIVSHTGADAPTRVLGQPIFDGVIGVPIANGPKTTFSPFNYRILRFYSVTARIRMLLVGRTPARRSSTWSQQAGTVVVGAR
jgi:hypothetical protein